MKDFDRVSFFGSFKSLMQNTKKEVNNKYFIEAQAHVASNYSLINVITTLLFFHIYEKNPKKTGEFYVKIDY